MQEYGEQEIKAAEGGTILNSHTRNSVCARFMLHPGGLYLIEVVPDNQHPGQVPEHESETVLLFWFPVHSFPPYVYSTERNFFNVIIVLLM